MNSLNSFNVPPQYSPPPSLLTKLVNTLCFLCALFLLPPTLGFRSSPSPQSSDRVFMPPPLHYDTVLWWKRSSQQSHILNNDNQYIEHMCKNQTNITRATWINSQVRLKMCGEYDVANVLGNVNFTDRICTKEIVEQSVEGCIVCLKGLFDMDQQSQFHVHNFNELIQRFQCTRDSKGTLPSTLGDTNCESCLTNYTAWICSAQFRLFPSLIRNRFSIDGGIPPCDSWCADVERFCPYFSSTGEQDNGGEPVFLCSEAHYHYMNRYRTLPSNSSTEQLCEFLSRQHEGKRCCYAGFHLKQSNSLSPVNILNCSLNRLCDLNDNYVGDGAAAAIGSDFSSSSTSTPTTSASKSTSHNETELLNLTATIVNNVSDVAAAGGAAATSVTAVTVLWWWWCEPLLISTTIIQLVVVHWCWIPGCS